jgi:hypothetical protein
MRDRLLQLVAATLLASCVGQHDGDVHGGGSHSPARESAEASTPAPRASTTSADDAPPDASAASASASDAGPNGVISGGGGAITGGGGPIPGAGDPPPTQDNSPRLGAKVVQLAVSGYHFCVRLANGGVSCWGDLPTQNSVFPPQPMPGLAGAIDVQIAGRSGCALFATGKVRCWGENSGGQLGDGLRAHGTCESPNRGDCSSEPVEVKGVTDAVELAVGAWTVCVRSAAGSVQCWGQLPTSLVGTRVNCLDGLNSGCSHAPVTLPEIRDARSIVLGADGYAEVCILRAEHPPHCLAFDATPFPRIPEALDVDRGRACAVVGGEVICWGDTPYGSNGDGRLDHPSAPERGPEINPPRAALGIRDAIAVALASDATCALHRDGHVSCWGLLGGGLAGDESAMHESCARLSGGPGPANVDCSATPISVPGITSAKTLALGASSACVTDTSDQLVCWGQFWSEAGSATRAATPIEGTRGITSLKMLAIGGCGVDPEGGVVCWGGRHEWMANKEFSSPTRAVRILAP